MKDESRIERKKKQKQDKKDDDGSNYFPYTVLVVMTIIVGVLGIVIGIFFSIFSGVEYELAEEDKYKGLESLESAENPTLVAEGTTQGEVDKMVEVVYYGDYGCPSCARYESSDALEYLKDEYIRTGEVKLTYRSISLIDEVNSPTTALADRAVWNQAPEKYWRWHSTTYLNQDRGRWATPERIKKWTNDLGINGEEIANNINQRTYQSEVRLNNQDFRQSKARGTPSFIIGNLKVNPNNKEKLDQLIEQQKNN